MGGAAPDDPDLHAEFAAARAAWRAEEEQAARDAWDAHVHLRTLDDALRVAAARGDLVRVTLGGHRVDGTLVELGDDLLVLRRPDGLRVDVHRTPLIPLMFRVVTPGVAHSGGRLDEARLDLRGRVRALEADGGECLVGAAGERDPLAGAVHAGRDHVVVRDAFANETFVAFDAVAFVSPRPA